MYRICDRTEMEMLYNVMNTICVIKMVPQPQATDRYVRISVDSPSGRVHSYLFLSMYGISNIIIKV